MTETLVLDFWFSELEPAQWWKKDDQLDETIQQRFGALHGAATACELSTWRQTPEGRLAEIITIDQFSRNIFRKSAMAFAWDPLALALAQEAVRAGADQELSVDRRAFLYLPFMHSESHVIHEQAVALYSQPGLESNLDFEHKHKAIIDRFGRYPHRNALLGRKSTPEEIDFLSGPGSSF